MVDESSQNVGWLKDGLVRKEDEVRYVPIPHPEDLKAWLSAAYEAGRRDGARSADLPEVTT